MDRFDEQYDNDVTDDDRAFVEYYGKSFELERLMNNLEDFYREDDEEIEEGRTCTNIL